MTGSQSANAGRQHMLVHTGALWKARAADGGAPIAIGNRVRVESVDGLTLVVRPVETQDLEKGS